MAESCDCDGIELKMKDLTISHNVQQNCCDNKSYDKIADVDDSPPSVAVSVSKKSMKERRALKPKNRIVAERISRLSDEKNDENSSPEKSVQNDECVSAFSKLSISSSSPHSSDIENEDCSTILERGKVSSSKSSRGESRNHSVYSRPIDASNDFPRAQLLHLVGGRVSVSQQPSNVIIPSTEINSISEICNQIENDNQQKNKFTYESNFGSPESGYGSPLSDSCFSPLSANEPSPSSSLDQEDSMFKNLLDFLSANETTPCGDVDTELDDIFEVIGKDSNSTLDDNNVSTVALSKPNENVINNKFYYIPAVAVVSQYIIVPVTNNAPKVKTLPRLCPKPTNSAVTENTPKEVAPNITAKDKPRDVLKKDLKHSEIVKFSRRIYNEIRNNEERGIIFIQDQEKKRSNLHIAVMKQELEHVFCLVEIHLQFQRNKRLQHKKGNKNTLDGINLVDSGGKTALDYARQCGNSQLTAYLEKSGALSFEKKHKK